jgi:hypothetical protein
MEQLNAALTALASLMIADAAAAQTTSPKLARPQLITFAFHTGETAFQKTVAKLTVVRHKIELLPLWLPRGERETVVSVQPVSSGLCDLVYTGVAR